MSDVPRNRRDESPLETGAPPRRSVFTPVCDRYGVRLALVFGNHAPGGLCPYFAAERCHHCDIGAGEGTRFDIENNLRRLAWFQAHHADVMPHVAHLILYNSGSVLNPREMPPELLDQILAFARSLPAIRAVSLDSREPYIRAETLQRLAEELGPGRAVRPILGLETANDRLRNGLLQKQMPRASVERAFEAVGAAAERLGADRVGLDVNIVLAGPGTTTEAAVEDAIETARFAFEAGRLLGVSVDLNLHPYYPGARGQARFPNHGRCSLAVLARSVAGLSALRRDLAPDASLFIGWEDEGHDREPGQRAAELARARDVLDRFNQTQEPGVLDRLKDEAVAGNGSIAQG